MFGGTKRQKEGKRKEKRQEKAAKTAARKKHKAEHGPATQNTENPDYGSFTEDEAPAAPGRSPLQPVAPRPPPARRS